MIRIDLLDLLEHPGASRTVVVDQVVEGLRLELASVPEDTLIHGDLLLESVVEGVLVSGPLSGRMSLSCARCLRPFEKPFEVQVHELFAAAARPDDDEYPLNPEGFIDIEPMVRDAVLLMVPFSPLCRADCRGLCERCGADRNLTECSCRAEATDPRWAALKGLLE